MKSAINVILFFIITSGLTVSQVVTAVAPLEPGNKWVYETTYPWSSYTETHQFEVSDSIRVINGISFYGVHIKDTGFPIYTAYYGKTPNQLFARYESEISDSLYTYFKTNPQKGDTWEQYWKNGMTIFNTITDTFSAQVFGESTLIYVIDRTDSVIVGSREYWTKEYGMLNGLYEQAEDILVGCVIDGVLYGDTTVTGIEEVKELPDNFILYQNYPNPFNPTTVINYSVKKAGLVKIKVYDVLGSEVAELVNETKEAGYHSVEFNASNLPSGVYIYTLQVNEFSTSKKMLLLK